MQSSHVCISGAELESCWPPAKKKHPLQPGHSPTICIPGRSPRSRRPAPLLWHHCLPGFSGDLTAVTMGRILPPSKAEVLTQDFSAARDAGPHPGARLQSKHVRVPAEVQSAMVHLGLGVSVVVLGAGCHALVWPDLSPAVWSLTRQP